MKTYKINDYFFIGFLLLISFAFLKLLLPFLIDIFLAFVLYIIFRKPFAFFLEKTKNRKQASAITVTLVIFVVSIPLFFVGTMVSFEATENYKLLMEKMPEIQRMLTSESLKELSLKIPVLGDLLAKEINTLDMEKIREVSSDILMSASSFTLSIIQSAFFNLTSFIMHLFITPFILFFLFLENRELSSKIRNVLPFERADEKKAVDELIKITDTIVIYTFLIGVAEGVYAGALFSIMGINSPFFWGVIMVILSMIPVLGSNGVIVPVAIFQIIIGNYTKGILLLVLGAGAVAVNQFIIKPKVSGDRSGLHPVMMLISTIGGIAWLGMSGFLVGPLIAALTIVSWDLFAQKFKTKDLKATE
ncbi:MAG: AI-2E family transporter [Candidatus Delongbacteria bacterium]